MTERLDLYRVNDHDIGEPLIWQINAMFTAESDRIDNFIRQRAKTTIDQESSPQSRDQLEETARDIHGSLEKFRLKGDEAQDIEVYDRALRGDIAAQAPRRATYRWLFAGALFFAVLEFGLFLAQATGLDEFSWIPLMLGAMLVLASFYAGYHLGEAMFAWQSYRAKYPQTQATHILNTDFSKIRFNVILFALLLFAVFAIAFIRSYDSLQSISTPVFLITLAVAFGVIGMEAWAIETKRNYNQAYQTMLKAQRRFASENHENRIQYEKILQRFIAHYNEIRMLKTNHDENLRYAGTDE